MTHLLGSATSPSTASPPVAAPSPSTASPTVEVAPPSAASPPSTASPTASRPVAAEPAPAASPARGRPVLGTVPAALVLAGAAAAALLAERLWTTALIALALLVACLHGHGGRRRLYLTGALVSGLGVVVLSPLLWSSGGGTLLWQGPIVPVLGSLDISTDELQASLLSGLRLVAVGLAFAAYALLLDHDRLVSALRFARGSTLAVALATRLIPTLERDAAGMAEAVRGRGIELSGVRDHATLLSPLVAGSLERASRLAEAMEARGFGCEGVTRAPQAAWTGLDRVAVGCAAALVVGTALWL